MKSVKAQIVAGIAILIVTVVFTSIFCNDSEITNFETPDVIHKYGFEILEDEEPLDYTSIDEDDGDLIDNERRWYEEDDYLEEEISIYKEEL